MKRLREIAKWFHDWDIDLYQVGGSVRDEIMGLPVDDVDVCVVGGRTAANISSLLEILVATQEIDVFTSVHGDFPIWIVEIDGEKYEFAMARTERKVGQSRQEFATEVRNVTIKQDLGRRDFSCNAIAKHLVTGEIVDPFEGRQDIKDKRLKHVGPAFREDALRCIRLARFCAKLDFTPHGETIMLAREMARTRNMKDSISNERVGKELMKVFEQVAKPSIFFRMLKETDWLTPWFQELHDCINVPQDPIHHPEGDVFTHTMHCIDAVEQGDWFTRAVMLCHDLGKATTTIVDEINFTDFRKGNPIDDLVLHLAPRFSKITSAGHEEAGVPLTRNMLQRISFCDHKTIRKIACLVELHMLGITINRGNFDKMVRRTLRKLMHYELTYIDLCYVIYCDNAGRPPRTVSSSKLHQDLYYTHSQYLLETDAMTPIVTGEKLLSLGYLPGEQMGIVIKHALELQDRGTLNKDNWLERMKGAHPHYFKQKQNEKSI